jgi:hypothetical protein
LILRLVCPECKKDSYSASVESFKPCPYCGILFSGKYGTEKRGVNRDPKEVPVTFSYNGQSLQASTLNFSENGLSLKIFGNAHLPVLPVGDIIELNIGNSLVTAQIVWVFNNPEATTAITGFKILDGNLKLP